MNQLFRIDVDLRGTIEVLADSEDDATREAQIAVTKTIIHASNRGLYLRQPDIKPKRVLEKGEGS